MPTISYQLYSSRNWDIEETIAMLAAAGFKEVEGVGPQYLDPSRTKALLQTHGMTMPTGHFAPDLIESDPESVISIARALGIGTVIAPYIAPEVRPTTLAGWNQFADRLAEMSKPIVAAGLEFAWHNHDFELLPRGCTNMATAFQTSTSRTSPARAKTPTKAVGRMLAMAQWTGRRSNPQWMPQV